MGSLIDRLDQLLEMTPSEEEGVSVFDCTFCGKPASRKVTHDEEAGCSFTVCLTCGEHIMSGVKQMLDLRKQVAEAQVSQEVVTEEEARILVLLSGFLEDDAWACKFCMNTVHFDTVRLVDVETAG